MESNEKILQIRKIVRSSKMELNKRKEKELIKFCKQGIWSSHLLPSKWVKELLIDQIKVINYSVLLTAAGIDTEVFDHRLGELVYNMNKEVNKENYL